MKKTFYVFAFLLTAMLNAQSFHTITMDGQNDFNTNNERFLTTSDTNLRAYFTWDANYLYFGFSGRTPSGTVTDNDRVFHLYLDTDPKSNPTQGGGTTVGEQWKYKPTLPISANYHYVFKTIDNTEYKKVWDGTNWVAQGFNTTNYKGAGYWELKIERTGLGDPKQLNLVAYVEEDWGTGAICGGMPYNLFTNILTPGNITFNNHYLNIYLIDQITPNATYNFDNYQWLVKLSASTAGVGDTSNFAGMGTNATDGFDLGVDLPKPAPAPSNYVELFFPHTDWTASVLGPKFSRDIKKLASLDSTSSTWNFSVNTDIASSTMVVNIDTLNFIPSNYGIKIYDITADSTHNVRTRGMYTYNSGTNAGERKFRLLIGTFFSAPKIVPNATAFNFGSKKVGKDTTLNLQITNTGDSILRVSNIISTSSVFTFTGGTVYTINKSQSVTIPIKFLTTAAGTFNGMLKIVSNDPLSDTLRINLTGIGVALLPKISVNRTAIDFGSIRLEYDTTTTLKIYNTGDTALRVSNIAINNSAFTLTTPPVITIPINDSATVIFRFKPQLVQSFAGTAFILHNDLTKDTIKVTLSGTGISSLVSNSFAAGWSLMSVPIKPNNPSAGSVIGSVVNPFFLYGYTKNVGYASKDTVKSGNAYWLGIETPAVISVSGVPLLDTISVPLNQGWNLSSSPYIRKYLKKSVYFGNGILTVKADSAASLGWIQNVYYGYNKASGYQSADTLNQWAGYWFMALQPNLRMLFYHDSANGNPLSRQGEPVILADNNNWNAIVTAEINGKFDNLLTFGVKADAIDGFDARYDFAKPPMSPVAGSIETFFPHIGWTSESAKFAADIRSPYQLPNAGKTWNFRVSANADGVIKLSWQNIIAQIPQNIRDSYRFELSGGSITGSINMLTTLNYQFTGVANTLYSFNISSTITGVKDNSLKDYSFILNQNYPNPFNPSTSISYQLPNSGVVTLKVYDVLGNEVRVLVDEVQSSGDHHISFNASDLSSGVYFYKLTQGEFSQTLKLILMK